MKLMIWIGIIGGGVVGEMVGAALDRGNPLGAWSIILSSIGSLLGILAGYKVGKTYF